MRTSGERERVGAQEVPTHKLNYCIFSHASRVTNNRFVYMHT